MPTIRDTLRDEGFRLNRKDAQDSTRIFQPPVKQIPLSSIPLVIPNASLDLSKLNLAMLNPNENVGTKNFVTGVSGWRIYGDGSVEFNNGTFRGALTASTIDIGGSDNTSFHVDINGNLWSGGATFATATFSVSSAGAMTATSGLIAGWTIAATALQSGATAAASNVLIDSANSLIRLGPTSGSYVTIDGANQRIRSSNYVSGFAGEGFTLEPNLLEVGNIAARGLIRSSVMQYNNATVHSGSQWIAQGGDVLDADMTALDASTFTVKGTDTFAVNDRLRIKDGTNDEWLLVTATGSAPTYSVTRDQAGAYAANSNPAWKKGASVINYGQSGAGGIYMTASDTNAPYISVFTHAGSPWSTLTTRLRVGNLNGYLDYVADIFGFAVGSSAASQANITIDPTNGIRVRSATTTLFQVDNAGTATIGSFTLAATTISATNLTLISGAANTANITVGTGANAGGLNSANAGSDIAFWAGSTFANRATAPFRVDAAGNLTATSATLSGYLVNTVGSFGGDSSDGAKTVSVDTVENSSYKIFNYSSLTIDSGKTFSFGANYQNKIIRIKVKGDCTINGTLSVKGAGSLGGAGGAKGADGTSGSAVKSDCLDALAHQGIKGVYTPASSPGGAGGAALTLTGIAVVYCTQDKKIVYIIPGVGGGGGAGGSSGGTGGAAGTGGIITATPTAGSDGTDGATFGGGGGGGGGGAGGGALILEVGGDLTIGASGVIDCSGQDGAIGGGGGDATVSGHGGAGGGGGGGGTGGMALILYNGTLSNSGTISVAGGAGGNGGQNGDGISGAGSSPGGSGGGGAGFYSGVGGQGGDATTASPGDASYDGDSGSGGGGGGGYCGSAGGGAGAAGGGGNGGTGNSNSGLYLLEKNTEFA